MATEGLKGLSFSDLKKGDGTIQDNEGLRAQFDSESRNILDADLSGIGAPTKIPRKPFYGLGLDPRAIEYDQQVGNLALDANRNMGLEMPEGFGRSRFDQRVNNAMDLEGGLENFRANEQSAFNKIASGTAKMGVTAASTYADSIFGTIAGLINVAAMAASGQLKDGNGTVAGNALNAFINNPVSQALNDITKSADELFKNYYTNEERDRKWYQNIFTANFLGDTLIKNAGFTIGAAYGARTMAAGTAKLFGMNKARDAYKGLVAELGSQAEGKSASEILDAIVKGEFTLNNVDLTKQLENAAKSLKRSEFSLQMAGALMAGAGEARIEAINASDELEQELREKYGDLDMQRENDKQTVLARVQSEHPELFMLQLSDNNTAVAVPKDNRAVELMQDMYKKIDDYYDQFEAEIQHQKANVANAVFGLNLPLLTFGDMVQFGKFILGDYATDRVVQTSLKSAATETLKESVESKGLKEGLESFAKAGYESAKSTSNRTLKATARGLGNALTETQEEMSQSWISSAQKDYGAHKFDEFNYRLTNPDSEFESRKWLESVYDGFGQSYGNIDNWVEGFSGFFMGALGLPGIRFNHNGKKIDVSMNGGMWDAFKESKSDASNLALTMDKINQRVQSPEFLNYYWGKIGHDAADKAMAEAAASGDEWAYMKADQMKMVNDIITFDNAGRLQDLEDMVEVLSAVTDENVDEMKAIFANSIGGDIAGMTTRAFKERVQENAKTMKNLLDKYVSVSNSMRQLYGSQYDDNVINELIWKTVRLDSIEDYINSKISEANTHLSTSIEEFRNSDDKYKDKTDYQILGMYDFQNFIKNHSPLTGDDMRWANQTLGNIRKAQSERNAYVSMLAKTSADPSVIQRVMEMEAEEKEVREAALQRAATETFLRSGSVLDMKQLMNENHTVDDEVKDILLDLNDEGVANAKEFLGFVNIAGSVDSRIDKEADSKGMNEDDKAILHKAWKMVVDSANGVADLLQERNPLDFGMDEMTDAHLAILNEAIEDFAQMNEYAEYLNQAANNAKAASAANQTFTGDKTYKLPKTDKRVKIVITPEMDAVDKKGNPVTGIYYITPSKDKHIYDNNGDRITREREMNTPYGKQMSYEDKIHVKIGTKQGTDEPITMSLVDAYNSNMSGAIFKPGVNAFIISPSVDEPWLDTATPSAQPPVATPTPAPAPVAPQPPVQPAPEPQPVMPAAIPPQTDGGNTASMSKSLVLVSATPKAAQIGENTIVGFAMRQKDGPIYVVDKDNDILGELPVSKYEKKQIHGLSELIDILRNEFDESAVNTTTGLFTSQLHTRVSRTFKGMDNTNIEVPINKIEGLPANIRDVHFILLTGKGNEVEFHKTSDSIQQSDIITTGNYSLAKGTVYMLLPRPVKDGERQTYTPIACRKTDMSPTVWQILQGSVVGDRIKDAIEKMLDAVNNEDGAALFEAKKELQKWIYLKNNSEGRQANNKNELFFLRQDRKIRVEANHRLIGFASSVDEMIQILSALNCGIDVRDELFDSTDGLNTFYGKLVETGLITANLKSFGEVGRFFMDPFVPDGNGSGTFQPASPIPANQVRPSVPPVSVVTPQKDEILVTLDSGNYIVKMGVVIDPTAYFYTDQTTGQKYSYEEAVASLGLDTARFLYSVAHVLSPGVKNDSATSMNGRFELHDPYGWFAYDRNEGKVLDQLGLDLLRADLSKKNKPAEPVKAVAEPAPVAAKPIAEQPAVEEKATSEPMVNGIAFEDPNLVDVVGEATFGGFLQMANTEDRKSDAEKDREFLEMMRTKKTKVSVAVNSLYNSFKKVNGKTFRGMGSEKNIRKALKGLVQDEVIDFLVEGIKQHPELKNMSPYDAFISLINAYSYDLAETYNKGVRKPAITALDNFLQNYFKQFNINVDYADLKSRLGNDVTAMFDVVAKTIYLAEGGNINQMTMPEEFAHAYIELMGSVMSKRPENADFTYLMNTVEETKIYRDVFNAYSKVYTKDGKPDVQKIKKEALGQALAAALVHNWEMKTETEKEKTFWDKLRELFEKVIQLFKDKEYVSFHNQIDKIAREILAGDVSRLRKVDDTGYRLLDYVETIENQNRMDGGKALNFMKYFNSLGNLITGSITYRRTGTVYRGKLDSLHDIDMIVPKSAHKIDIDKIYDTKLNLDQVSLYDYMMNEPYFKKIKADYPKCRFCAAYADKNNRRITVNAIYCEDESISERFASYTGSYAERLERFTEAERQKIYLFDFFVEYKDFKAEHDQIYGLDMVESDKPRQEKLFMGRAKDIFDYQMWKDFSDLRDREFSDSRFLMFQKERRLMDAAERAVGLSKPIERDIDMRESTEVSVEDWGYLQERGWNQETWDKLSEREKERALDCVRA